MRRINRVFAAFFACGLLLGQGAHAAAPPVARPPAASKPAASKAAPADDAAKVAAAREFILLYHPQTNPANVKMMLDNRIPRMIERKKKRIKNFDAKKFEAEMRTRIMAGAVGKLDLQAHIVSRHFSLAELKALVAFFKGPLGSKLVAETPKIQRDMLQIRRQDAASMQGAADADEDEDEDDDAPAQTKSTKPTVKLAPAKPQK